MNKIRIASGESLQRFFYELQNYSNDLLETIPHYEILHQIFIQDVKFDDDVLIYSSDWIEPSNTYNKIMPLISLKEYSFTMFEGLIISVGGITEDVTRCSLEALTNLISGNIKAGNLQMNPDAIIELLYSHIIKVLEKNEKNDRIIEPLFNTVSNFFTKNEFLQEKFEHYCREIHRLVGLEIKETKNIHKVLSCVDIHYNLLFFARKGQQDDVYCKAMRSLLFLMLHKYPVVRKKASEQVYLFLTAIEDPTVYGIDQDTLDEVSLLICEANWTEPVATNKETRNSVAKTLNINIEIAK